MDRLDRANRLRINLDAIEELMKENCTKLKGLAMSTGVAAAVAGGCFMAPAWGQVVGGVLGTLSGITFAGFVNELRKYITNRDERRRLTELLSQQLGQDVNQFMRRNPLAEVRLVSRNVIQVILPSGQSVLGYKEGEPTGEGAGTGVSGSSRTERQGSAGEQESLGEPAPNAGSMRQRPISKVRPISGLPAPAPRLPTIPRIPPPSRIPTINPAYEAIARGTYPRLGSTEDEEQKDGAP